MGKKTRYWLIEDRDKRSLKTLNQKLEYDIYIWDHKRHRYMSGATNNIVVSLAWHPSFCFFYWLLYLGGHAFVLAFLRLKV